MVIIVKGKSNLYFIIIWLLLTIDDILVGRWNWLSTIRVLILTANIVALICLNIPELEYTIETNGTEIKEDE